MTVLQIRPIVCQGKHTYPPGTCACVFVRLIKKKEAHSLIRARRANICPEKESRECNKKCPANIIREKKNIVF